MSANGYAMDLGECVAAALMTMRTAAKQDHDWQTVFALIPAHPMALIGSAVDDAWLSALNRKDEGTMTTMTARKEQKIITGTERLRSSVNGNPRYRVTFADGTDARTGVDSGIAYSITNSDLRGGPVEITFDGRGNIVDARPVNEPWDSDKAAKLSALARQVLAGEAFHMRGHDGYDDVLTRENCGACVLAGYEDPSGEQTVDRDGPNYAGWARIYVQARRAIPERWRDAFTRELHSDNAAYSAALARDIATFGVTFA